LKQAYYNVSLALLCCLIIGLSKAKGQSSHLYQNHKHHHFLDRNDVLFGTEQIHLSLRKYSRGDLLKITARKDSFLLSSKDIQDKYAIINDNESLASYPHRKGFLKQFYKNPAHLYQLETTDFDLVINPILNLRAGYESSTDEMIYLNSRGIEMYGSLDNKLYFYTTFHENQSNFFDYQEAFINQYSAIRGQGNYKDYQSSVVNSVNGYDYGFAKAYLGIQVSKHTQLELGHDRHFIGNGMRSLLLGDEGHNYFYLKFDVKIWKLHYQSLFAELQTISARYTPNNNLLPKKYMAAHYFSYKPKDNFELGFFEGIVFSRQNNFELQYLNPVIFYRTVEFQLDSPDNVLLGMNMKWNILKRFSLYGQLLLDEFNLAELRSSEQWWGNKYGLQLGLKYINILGVDHLDGQVEWNKVRPFTYSHREPNVEFPEISIANYSHFMQPLAHPLGANFTEYIFKLRYQPTQKLIATVRYLYTKVGRSTDINYGGEILAPDVTRNADYGIAQNQGALSTIQLFDLNISYEVFHNFYIDLQLLRRKDSNPELSSYSTDFIGGGIRYNISQKTIDY